MSAVLRVRDENGKIIEIPAIKGDKGDDGYSPTVEVTDIESGHQVSITDAAGVKSFKVMNGFTMVTATAKTKGTSVQQNYSPITFQYSDYTGSTEVLPTFLVVTTSPKNSETSGRCFSTAINCKALALGKIHTFSTYSNSTIEWYVKVTPDGSGGMTIETYIPDSSTFPVTATLMI